MPKTTQLFGYHKDHAKLTEFAGYEMPLWYTTTTEEHMAVRTKAGLFDVSHMGRLLVTGDGTQEYLEKQFPTKVGPQPAGKALYTLLLNERAGIVDDLVALKISDTEFILVVNAANASADIENMSEHLPSGVQLVDITGKTAMIALQGPHAQEVLQPLTPLPLRELKRLRCAETEVLGEAAVVSRSGYTGEDGFEIIVRDATVERPENALRVWEQLSKSSAPCGLAARDTLRLEAGLLLHGSDMDQGTNPFEVGLQWLLTSGKTGYVGSEAIELLRMSAIPLARRGVVLDRGIPRHGFDVLDASDTSVGTITSGTFSPVLRKGIGLCRVKAELSAPGGKVAVSVRGSSEEARLTTPPFYDETVYGWKRHAQP